MRRAKNRAHARQKSHSPSHTSTGFVSVGVVVLRVLSSLKMIGLHVLTVVLVALMVSLGFWQLRRHDARVTFNDAVRARGADAARSPDDLLALSPDPANLEWYQLVVSGTYVPNEDLLLVNLSQDGRAGVDPISALRLDDGRILLVNRGFIPLTETVPMPPVGRVTVAGRVRVAAPRQRGELSDAALGELREIQRIDIDRLAAQLPGAVLPVYIDLFASEPADSPVLSRIADPELTIGSHLSYTVQWFVFALCAVVAWVIIVRRVLAAARQATTST